MPAPIGLQLYSVREVAQKEGYATVVKKVAAMGYAGVEPAGYPGSNAAEAAKLFQDLGLAVPMLTSGCPSAIIRTRSSTR